MCAGVEGNRVGQCAVGRFRFVVARRRQCDLQDHIEVAGRRRGDASTPQAQFRTRVRAGGNLQIDEAPGCGCLDTGAERGFPRRHRQIEVQVAAVDAIRLHWPASAPLGYVNFAVWLIPAMFGVAYRRRLLSARRQPQPSRPGQDP